MKNKIVSMLLAIIIFFPYFAFAEEQKRDTDSGSISDSGSVSDSKELRDGVLRESELFGEGQDSFAGEVRTQAEPYLGSSRLETREQFLTFVREKKQTEAKEKRREFLFEIVTDGTDQLEAYKEKIPNSRTLSVERGEEIRLIINEYIAIFGSYSREKSLTEAEVKEIAREMRVKWQEARKQVKWWNIELHFGQIDRFMERNDLIVQRILKRINEMAASGIDTTELANMFIEFEKAVNLAKGNVIIMKEFYYEEGSSAEDLEEILTLIKGYREYFNEMESLLADLVAEMKRS